MVGKLLSSTDTQEALSRAYVAAVAARAGFTTSVPDFDRDSVDVVFGAGGKMRPCIAAQLKATINLRRVGTEFRFSLKKKNYDDLRVPTMMPRVLIVLAMPKKDVHWLNSSHRQLVMKKCAYWVSLRGLPDIETETVTVGIPVMNHFNVGGLSALMQRAAQGNPL